MRFLTNRIVISLVVIVWFTYMWEFYIKPQGGPVYTAAVVEYKAQNYTRSLEILKEANRIDSGDTSVLTLMGWCYLKLGDATIAEAYFKAAHDLAPNVHDTLLGYAYTEIELQKYDEAERLLNRLREKGVSSTDLYIAWASLYRDMGRNRDAAREFQRALDLDSDNAVALKNLAEIYNVPEGVQPVSLEFQPLQRPANLIFTARAERDYFAWREGDQWKRVYLTGVNLSPALPGRYPLDAATDEKTFSSWLELISALGANTVRASTILPPAFYRALHQFNTTRAPLWLVQGIPCGDPPRSDLFDTQYVKDCQAQVRDTIDVIHGQGDVRAAPTHAGGIFTSNLAAWVAGLLVGPTLPSHIVTATNLLHPEIRAFQGTYVEVPAGSPTEVFLAQMINYAVEYEVSKYNWQHPAAFLNWPSLDPMRHPTESTLLEEVSIRRARGERLRMPPGPYDDDDAVGLDPKHLRARERFAAGLFAAYSVFPYYPDFINQDERYLAVHDAEGSNPFLGYLRDLKANHRTLPLLITDYGMPTSLGIGHYSPVGFDEGGKTEAQQGQLIARLTHNIHESGAAGGLVFEWLDQWFRQSWLHRNYKQPPQRTPLWTNFMDTAEHFGFLAADPRARSVHQLTGEPAEWANIAPLYDDSQPRPFQALGDRYDPARNLRALYSDADEGFLYLRLTVDKLDNDDDGQPDWPEVNFLIGLSTAPGQAGLTYLPFITPLRFPTGMTHAVHLVGAENSRIWIASTYNPYHIVAVEGIPTHTTLLARTGWRASISDTGTFEPQVLEPNRRRFARDGTYFPPQRHDRSLLRYGTLNPQAPGYDSQATWHANIQTNTIDLRIPYGLLNIVDPSSMKVFAGIDREGGVQAADSAGVILAAFAYRPLETARLRPMMEQAHPIADALPGMTSPASLRAGEIKTYRWAGWKTPQYKFRLKDSYAILQQAFRSLPPPAPPEAAPPEVAAGARRSQADRRTPGGNRAGR